MFKIKSLLLAAVMGWGVAHADTETFTIDFSATSEAGRPVTGSLTLGPEALVVTNDTAPDGSLHQRTSGYNAFYANSGPAGPWSVKELGGESIFAIYAWYAGEPDARFQVDAYLHTDGSSELKLTTKEQSADHAGSSDSSLSFTLACACSSLYSATINAGTFAHYDEIRSGEAKYVDTYYVGSTLVERTQSVKFSAAAVPEPASVALVLAGGLTLLGTRRWRSMPV